MKRMIDLPVRLSLPIFRIAFVCVLLGSAFSASAQWLPAPWTSGPLYFPGTNAGIGTSDTSLANDCDAGLVIAGSSPALRLHGTGGSNMDAIRRTLTAPQPVGGGGACGDYQLSAGGDTGGFRIFDVCAGAPRLTIDTDGNVGADSIVASTLKAGNAVEGWLMASTGSIRTSGGGLQFGTITSGTLDIERSWITMTSAAHGDSAGNVGIGSNTSPIHQLDVSGAPVVNGGANEILGVYDTRAFAAGVGGGIAFGGKINATGTTAQNFASIQGIKENATSGDTASALLFFTHANAGTPAERMRIGSDGLLTVGATGGTGMKLAVNGSIRSFSGGFQFPDGTTQTSAAIGSQWGQSGSSIFYSAGNVGIGSGMTSPSSPLSVNGVVYSAAGGFKFPDNTTQTSAAINSQWGQSGSSISYVAGNVGIGSGMTSPSSPLSVNGVVYSAAGGFKFPDNTIQTTAAQGSGGWSPGQSTGSVFHSGGSVGIGTDHPDAPLQVTSSTDTFMRVSSTATNLPYADFILSNSAGPAYGEIRVGDNATWRNLVLLKNGGGVVIGNETAPAASLHVKGGATTSGDARRTIVAFDSSASGLGVGGGISFGGNYSATSSTTDFANIWGIKESIADNNKAGALLFGTTANSGTPTERMRIGSDGLVTIAGTGTGTRLKVKGDIDVDGNINAKYQDVAEWVPTAEMLPAGTVVVLDPTVSNQVMASVDAYATTVAGVISDRPGITLGEGGAMKLKVATTGRVKVKVDATKSAVHIGDLLVTGDRPGTAMKSQPIDVGGMKIHRPGTLIGKALEPLAGGQGEILVLLSLQ